MTPNKQDTSQALDLISVLEQDRALCVVRAPRVADPAGLAETLATAGIRMVEFTFTMPGVPSMIEAAVAAAPSALVGAGTVLTPAQAHDAIAAGARFLLTPDLRPEVARIANEAGVPVIMGALTPSEVGQALDLGASAVKIFPARIGGPAYIKDLRGPFPGVKLIPTGGVNAGNARAFLDAGALALGAGTDVVRPDLVEAGDHQAIAERAAIFVGALKPS
jgi:2-dehydro-3-deoxyphosphogluconate aldolase / (4S)-4-hydroxy-2-oxoglutarate aldolase